MRFRAPRVSRVPNDWWRGLGWTNGCRLVVVVLPVVDEKLVQDLMLLALIAKLAN